MTKPHASLWMGIVYASVTGFTESPNSTESEVGGGSTTHGHRGLCLPAEPPWTQGLCLTCCTHKIRPNSGLSPGDRRDSPPHPHKGGRLPHKEIGSGWEGNGNPLQCSCLENPRDGGAWWAAVYGVTQSRTRLKWLSSNSSRSKQTLC